MGCPRGGPAVGSGGRGGGLGGLSGALGGGFDGLGGFGGLGGGLGGLGGFGFFLGENKAWPKLYFRLQSCAISQRVTADQSPA